MSMLFSINEEIQEQSLSMRCLLAFVDDLLLLLVLRTYLKQCILTIVPVCIITGGFFTSSLLKMNIFQEKNATLVTSVVSRNF